MRKDRVLLFITGMVQVFFVALNTYQISHKKYIPAIFTAFVISFIWTFNVKKIAFGTMIDRILYASGAATGTGIGFIMLYYLYK